MLKIVIAIVNNVDHQRLTAEGYKSEESSGILDVQKMLGGMLGDINASFLPTDERFIKVVENPSKQTIREMLEKSESVYVLYTRGAYQVKKVLNGSIALRRMDGPPPQLHTLKRYDSRSAFTAFGELFYDPCWFPGM